MKAHIFEVDRWVEGCIKGDEDNPLDVCIKLEGNLFVESGGYLHDNYIETELYATTFIVQDRFLSELEFFKEYDLLIYTGQGVCWSWKVIDSHLDSVYINLIEEFLEDVSLDDVELPSSGSWD